MQAHRTGQFLWNYVPVVLQVKISYQPGIADVTGDGAVEVIVGKVHDVK